MKILFITTRFPYPPIKGDQAISYHRLRILSRAHEITLLSFYDHPDDLKHLNQIESYCKSIHLVRRSKIESALRLLLGIFSHVPFQVLFYQSASFQKKLRQLLEENRFDLTHGILLRLFPYFDFIRRTGVPVFLEIVDSMQLNIERKINLERGLKRLFWQEELHRMSKYEPKAVEVLKTVTVVAQGDRERIGVVGIEVLPLGVDTEVFNLDINKQESKPQNSIIFSGNMAYSPNIHAVKWFVENCFPIIQKSIQGVSFTVVGSSPPPEILQLERIQGVTVTGFVESMPRALMSATVAIAPMQSGSGMQFKILEAMACMVPVVTTKLGLGSIAAVPERDLFVADSAESFSNCVIKLLQDQILASQIGTHARQLVVKNHSWLYNIERIEEIYNKITLDSKGL